MTDEELIAQAASLMPVYVDGFGAFRKTNGVFRTVGFVADTGAVLNLVVLLEGARQANLDAQRALDRTAGGGFDNLSTVRVLAH